MTAPAKPSRRKRPAVKPGPIIRLVPPFTGKFDATIGGEIVPCRRDGKLKWSFLDYRYQHLGTRTGRTITFPGHPGLEAPEVIVPTPWGDLPSLVWNFGGDVVFLGGRQSLGGMSPAPDRRFADEDDARRPARGRVRASGLPCHLSLVEGRP
ncbi:hypothetical protein EDC65_3594 [Stella humosa]|uniref:Uncharacterized protein n=1 Tax=Stella humosa TaxID=94 RepID=A0A3N1L4A9_9PROT|nr:hypothetical protein [Stella humosa]ROP84245.1 hypothetical protein EDC65_3594 [Stella humosa]BBK33758.1 hypothetical protein STHU_43920 [Stella humosa]